MFRNVIIRRFLAVSVAFSSFGIGTLMLQGGGREAFAQPAAPKPDASIAPKNAPAAPVAPSASAPPTPTPTPTELPAAPPAPLPEQPPPPPVTETLPAAPPKELAAQWEAVYQRGKGALASGAFPLASRMLNDVAKRAPDPALRAQARELGQLASYWSYHRLSLMPNANTLPQGATPFEPREDKRSTDELGILYGNTLVWGTGFGIAVGFASDNADASTFFLPAIGMSALGAGALAFMDLRHGPLPYGVPQSITSGMYMGLVGGLYVSAILEGEDAVRDEEKVFPGLVWGSMTAGALVGGLVGATVPITPGRASFTSSGAIWGGALTTLVTLGFEDDDFTSGPFITGLLGATAGGVTTGLLGGSIAPSIARVRFIDVGAISGGLLFGGLYASLADNMDGQALSFITSAGVVAGLATSFWLTNGMDRDEPRRTIESKTSTWHAAPFMTPQPGGGTLGLSGTF